MKIAWTTSSTGSRRSALAALLLAQLGRELLAEVLLLLEDPAPLDLRAAVEGRPFIHWTASAREPTWISQ